LTQTSAVMLEPRKSPVQARSMASVEAILDATIQVLLAVGKDRLTTTRVAQRAGVSVGTLYQYFPNKSALLKAVLERHLDAVVEAVEQVSREQRGKSLSEMGAALVTAFLAAKMRHVKASAAMYAVSSDFDGAKIRRQMSGRIQKAITSMLLSAQEPYGRDVELAASVLQGSLAGVSQRLLESPTPEKFVDGLREEMIVFVIAYLGTGAAH
jgi:AcrR family transcriptional regulator